MTSKDLRVLLDRLNKGKFNGLIHLRPLSNTVNFGKVWTKVIKKTDRIFNLDGPGNFYFINNDDGVFVAAVLDMNTDLHWFVNSKFRNKGYLTNAMKDTILPHLFQSRDRQRVTIDENSIGRKNYLSSRNVALNLGFTQDINGCEFFIDADKVNCNLLFSGENRLLPKDRLEQLMKEVNYLGRSLWLIHSEIEMNLGESQFTEELLDLAKEVRTYASKFEDAWWDCKKGM